MLENYLLAMTITAFPQLVFGIHFTLQTVSGEVPFGRDANHIGEATENKFSPEPAAPYFG